MAPLGAQAMDWNEQLCPICQKPLLAHLLISQDVEATYATRLLELRAVVACPTDRGRR
jgi:hypothetical protein